VEGVLWQTDRATADTKRCKASIRNHQRGAVRQGKGAYHQERGLQREDAHAYVDENFVYRAGEMVYAKNFNPDRFVDSGGGIHVWMTQEEAIDYLG
jgi:hypothetical protein